MAVCRFHPQSMEWQTALEPGILCRRDVGAGRGGRFACAKRPFLARAGGGEVRRNGARNDLKGMSCFSGRALSGVGCGGRREYRETGDHETPDYETINRPRIARVVFWGHTTARHSRFILLNH